MRYECSWDLRNARAVVERLRNYRITALVALVAFLPVLWRNCRCWRRWDSGLSPRHSPVTWSTTRTRSLPWSHTCFRHWKIYGEEALAGRSQRLPSSLPAGSANRPRRPHLPVVNAVPAPYPTPEVVNALHKSRAGKGGATDEGG
jgi:hypothetical protein